jgi:hypothetical protein
MNQKTIVLIYLASIFTGVKPSLYFRLKVSAELPSLKTISAFLPSGRKNATFNKEPTTLLSILVDPAGTNFEACATI